MAVDEDFLNERIEASKKAIVAIEEAIIALVGGTQTHTLDTGQTRVSVTKADLGSLRLQLNSAENRLATQCARRDGSSFSGQMWS